MTTSRDLMIIAMDAAPGRHVEQGDLSLALAAAEVIDLLAVEAATLDGDRIVPGLGPATDDPLLSRAVSSLVRQAPYEPVGDWLWRRGRGLSAEYLAVLEAEGLFGRQRRRGLFSRARRDVPADTPARRAAVERLASAEPVLAALASALGLYDAGVPGVSVVPGTAHGRDERDGRDGHQDPVGSDRVGDDRNGRNGVDAPDGHDGTGRGLLDGTPEGDGSGRETGRREVREDVGSGGSSGTSTGVSDDVDTVLAAVLDALTELQAIRHRRAIEQAAFDNVWRG
ncbi:GPP34 family phosphoprotein [Streptomyces spongiicola]|uniref:GPP34 family phosphoprotein n=1 Tax=Streptomyces spongiicola TaxID=1690221 RepID=A0A388SVF3_9ACTN|nr:GPP34 family phosphoprotein [Streptomyces spongiicola]GBP98984.1 GPP34 family phosphoprotein [Streptomyces spongiicola]